MFAKTDAYDIIITNIKRWGENNEGFLGWRAAESEKRQTKETCSTYWFYSHNNSNNSVNSNIYIT